MQSVRRRHLIAIAFLLLVAMAGCASDGEPSRRTSADADSAGAQEADRPRRLALSGTLNTRDLGGYETVDGRRTRWGVLYRSDEPDRLTEKDLLRLRELGVYTYIDLRTEEERYGQVERIPAGSRSVLIPIFHPSMDPSRIMSRIFRGDASDDYFNKMLQRANRSFALEHGEEVVEVVKLLAQPDTLPALFHCTYGKDRTGFVAAAILSLLGVPPETIEEDYLLSNVYLEKHINRMSRLIWLGSLFRISRDEARDLLGVRPEYIQSARASLLEKYGSFEDYALDHGLTEEILEQLRENLLE